MNSMAMSDLSVLISHLLLFIVSLSSAVRMLKVHRGAAAGFLLQSLASALGSACFLLPGLSTGTDTAVSSSTWTATVIGLTLLSFAFFWLNGDHSTANVMLGAVLLLAASSGHLTSESRHMAACLVYAAASVSILVLSLFTGNGYGLIGSLALGTVGLLSSLKAEHLSLLPKQAASNYVLAAAFLTCDIALCSEIR